MRNRWFRLAGVAGLAVMAVLAACSKSELLAGGKLHFTQGRYEKALELFQKAVAEKPLNAEAHLWYARSLAQLERDEEAVAELRKALELDVEQKPMVDNTYQSFWSERYRSAVKFVEDGEAARQKGNAAEATTQLQQAVDRFRRAIIFAPDSVQNYSNLGKVLFLLEQRDEAMAQFQQAKSMSAGKPRLQDFH